ncbi:MAG: radical SAM protein [bacterium]|jgi:DNA repair photolyase|nr:radical SAM protein [bacterium]
MSPELIAKQVVIPTKDGKRWFGIQYQVNLYRGCSHGCIYCDSRSECYQNVNFEEIRYKSNAIELLSKELSNKPKHQIIGLGSMSDPYNPLEVSLELTKKALEMLDFLKQGVVIITKSDRVLRDSTLLKRISSHSPVVVIFTITTTHETVQKKLEPNVSTTNERFKAIQKLTSQGIKCGILMMPILPFINDTVDNVEQIVRRAKEVHADFIYPAFGMTLRDIQRDYFYQMLDKEFPGLKNVYMDYYGAKYSCQSPHAAMLKKAFVFECRKQKILYGMNDIIETIRPNQEIQLKLF